MLVAESVLCWNYRGAASKEFVCEQKDIMKEYKPLIVVLVELRISGIAADEYVR